MTKPITPDEVVEKQLAELPERVIEVWNTEIAKGWEGSSATVYQEDVLTALRIEFGADDRTIFDRHWLDIEDIYRKVGWDVEYDKPGYNESYRAKFIFTRHKS